jgi:hypothetical protein
MVRFMCHIKLISTLLRFGSPPSNFLNFTVSSVVLWLHILCVNCKIGDYQFWICIVYSMRIHRSLIDFFVSAFVSQWKNRIRMRCLHCLEFAWWSIHFTVTIKILRIWTKFDYIYLTIYTKLVIKTCGRGLTESSGTPIARHWSIESYQICLIQFSKFKINFTSQNFVKLYCSLQNIIYCCQVNLVWAFLNPTITINLSI